MVFAEARWSISPLRLLVRCWQVSSSPEGGRAEARAANRVFPKWVTPGHPREFCQASSAGKRATGGHEEKIGHRSGDLLAKQLATGAGGHDKAPGFLDGTWNLKSTRLDVS